MLLLAETALRRIAYLVSELLFNHIFDGTINVARLLSETQVARNVEYKSMVTEVYCATWAWQPRNNRQVHFSFCLLDISFLRLQSRPVRRRPHCPRLKYALGRGSFLHTVVPPLRNNRQASGR